MHLLEGKNDTEGLLLLIDFEKTFDSIEQDFSKQALVSFNFGPLFCKWFDVLHADDKSCVMMSLFINTGNVSQFFNIERGCGQGTHCLPICLLLYSYKGIHKKG